MPLAASRAAVSSQRRRLRMNTMPEPSTPRQMYLHGSNATTTGQWVLTLFLVAIPIVNIILLFVWAFSSNTEDSKQNWARANLIWILIGIIISIIIVAVAMVLGIDVSQYYQRA